ncbi:M24 family metallopeptidase [Methylobacterium sp. ID0610]|uniref:M24 family metallopeptidase n=1 Tax=Methylobacterium carpenticola TaxID=3344827 RepID=UPI00367FCEBE
MGAHPAFAPAEFADRLRRTRAALAARGVAVGIFDECESMAWLTGYGNSENRWRCVVVPVEGEPFILIRALDAAPCRERSAVTEIGTFLDWEAPLPILARMLAERGWAEGPVGFDYGSPSFTARRFAQAQAALPRARITDLGPLVAELRLIKSAAEIALIRTAAGIADAALRRAAAACRAGGSQRDAALAATAAFIELGAEPGAPGPISAGRGWDFLHGHMTEAALAPGDVVHIELIPRVLGYSARIMRCVAVGEPAPALAEAAATLAALQDRQIAAMRPGAVARDVDRILREGVVAAGLRERFDNITGYTLGFYSHATTHTSDFTRIFHPEAAWRLEPGMVFHIYASAAGVSFSETVLVTESGPEILTRTPRTLLSAGDAT